MSKIEIEISGMPERGVGKREWGVWLVLYAENEEGEIYPVYYNSSHVMQRKRILQEAQSQVKAAEKQGLTVKNFRLARMTEEEAVEKGILPGMDKEDMPQLPI